MCRIFIAFLQGMRKCVLAGIIFILCATNVAAACEPGYYLDTDGGCTICPMGYYCTNDVMIRCPAATYADATGQSQCTPCPPAKKYADFVVSYDFFNTDKNPPHISPSGCMAIFAYPLAHGGPTPQMFECFYSATDNDYGVSTALRVTEQLYSSMSAQIKSASCDGGYWAYKNFYSAYRFSYPNADMDIFETLIQTACQAVGSEYYSPPASEERFACPAGTHTTGYGTGADDKDDCGHFLHIGGKRVHLRAAWETSPTLVLEINGRYFYGNMTDAMRGNIRIKFNDKTYSLYDTETE